jgi:hypothetical protein
MMAYGDSPEAPPAGSHSYTTATAAEALALITRWWPAVLAVAAVGGSLAFTCVTPFATFAEAAAVALRRRSALGTMAVVWLRRCLRPGTARALGPDRCRLAGWVGGRACVSGRVVPTPARGGVLAGTGVMTGAHGVGRSMGRMTHGREGSAARTSRVMSTAGSALGQGCYRGDGGPMVALEVEVTAGRRWCLGRSAAHGRLHGRGDRAWWLHEPPWCQAVGGVSMACPVRSVGDGGVGDARNGTD